MKKIDEMDKNIRLRSSEIGYKFLLLTLSMCVLFECYLGIIKSKEYNIIPLVLLASSLSIQSSCEMFMKRKMISNDEEYKEPNRIVISFILFVSIVSIIISVGFFISSI